MEINEQNLRPVLQRMGFDALTPMQLKTAEADTSRLQLIAPTGTGKLLPSHLPRCATWRLREAECL